MTTEPLVSVIIIFHQAARFISEAIESVLSQTMSEWELLLVDDGSTDESRDIALRYARSHPGRIRYLEHEGRQNRGMAASRKRGMRAARGRYIAFLDADDVFMPERLRAHVAIIERMPTPSVVVGSELYWFSWDATADSRYRQRDFAMTAGVTPNVVFQPPELLTLLIAPGGAAMPGICSITFHRLETDGLQGAPDEFTSLYEDQCLIAILLSHRTARVTEECLAKYRIHSMSSTALASLRGEVGLRRPGSAEHRYLLWLREYLAHHQISDPHLGLALSARLFLYEHPFLGRVAATARLAVGLVRSWLVRALRTLFDDSRFDGLRRFREALRRARVRRRESRLRSPGIASSASSGLAESDDLNGSGSCHHGAVRKL